MLFSAGLGTRMGSLTAARPKPLIKVGGKPLVDHALDQAISAGIETIVANVHYLADQLIEHLEPRGISISDETGGLLETGGGLRNALPLLGTGPVFTLNTDVVWRGANPLDELGAAWDPDRMDALLLLVPRHRAQAHAGPGDFSRDPTGRVERGGGFVFTGAQIIKTDTLDAIEEDVFSLNRVWDRLLETRRLFGTIHAGAWCDVGHPAGLAAAESLLEEKERHV